MSTGPASLAFDLRTALQVRYLSLLLFRCVVVSIFTYVGFSCLAYLARATRVAANSIQVDEDTLVFALTIGLVCAPTLIVAALMTEVQIVLLLASRWSWYFCQLLLPTTFAILGGLFAWYLFHPGEHGPKETLMVAGGALTTFLACGIQLALWRSTVQPAAPEVDYPPVWYVLLVLLGVTFLGAMKGWTGIDPKLRELLEYRSSQAQKSLPVRPLPAEPSEPPPFY